MFAAGTPRRGRISLALVHHANQYLITDGYDNREGLRDIVGVGAAQNGLLPLLYLHLRYRVPLNLHLSGTLIEALAWHHPDVFAALRPLKSARLLEVLGSALSQPAMPLFSQEFNARQVKYDLWLQRHHLECEPSDVRTFWVPERLWQTDELAGVIASSSLANGGYQRVLLDDRLMFPTNGCYSGSPREDFDRLSGINVEAFTPCEIAGGHGLVAVPISRTLRYLIPPCDATALDELEALLSQLAQRHEQNAIAVYADDLEKAAGVACWDPRNLARYEAFLQWLKGHEWIEPVLLGRWAASHPASAVRRIDAGAFYELAQSWGAGEDYSGWHRREDAAACLTHFAAAERAVREPERQGADQALLKLGWQHLMHCAYETLWHDPPDASSGRPSRLAPWTAALASHVRSCRVIALAAEWVTERDGAAHAQLVDVDGDGELEVVLKNDHLFAVLSPVRGARLIFLFDLTGRSGRLVIGNVSDDWNWQQELNRFMDRPRNHPGALSDVGHEHDLYEVGAIRAEGDSVVVNCRNVQAASTLFGATKQLRLVADSRSLAVAYRLPPNVDRLSTEVCLSPNYYRLLRQGRGASEPFNGRDWRGWATGSTRVWLRFEGNQHLVWDKPEAPECGHGFNLRVTAFARDFQLELGVAIPVAESSSRKPAPMKVASRGRVVAAHAATLLQDGKEVAGISRMPAPVATRPRIMREFFNRHLPALEMRWSRVQDCRVRVLKRHHDQIIVEYKLVFDVSGTGATVHRAFVGIWCPDDSGAEVYRQIRALWDRGFTVHDGFRIAEPLAYWNVLQLALYTRAPGRPLKQLIYSAGTKWPIVLGRVAAWLAKFHATPPVPVRVAMPSADIAELERWREDLIRSRDAWLEPELTRVDDIMRRLIDERREIDDGARCLTHGDFQPENVLIHTSAVTAIDFEHMALASPAADVGFFLGELEIQSDRHWARRGRPNPVDIARFSEVFVDAYCRRARMLAPGAVPYYCAQTYLKHLMYTVRMRGTEQRTNVTRWLDRAEALLDDCARVGRGAEPPDSATSTVAVPVQQ